MGDFEVNDFFDFSVDQAALAQHRFEPVAPMKVSPHVQFELGLLTQKREREELARRQRIRQQNLMSVHPGGGGRRNGPGAGKSLATQAKSVAGVTGTSVDLPGHYVMKEINEPAPQMHRINHTVVRYEGTLYMFGGRTGSSPAAQYVQDLHQFVPGRMQWVLVGEEHDGGGMGAEAAKALKNKRAKDRAGLGGMVGDGTGGEGASTHPGRRGDHSAVMIGHDMYVFGGRRQQVPLDDMYAFRRSNDAAPNPLKRACLPYAPSPDRLLCLSVGAKVRQSTGSDHRYDDEEQVWLPTQ